MSHDVGSELKNFIDGKRSVVDIWQYLFTEYPEITLDQVITALNNLKDKNWIVLE